MGNGWDISKFGSSDPKVGVSRSVGGMDGLLVGVMVWWKTVFGNSDTRA